MNNTILVAQLASFQNEHRIRGKGSLAVAIHISRIAREKGLPLDADRLITGGSGQVVGLGKRAVQQVLNDYGLNQVLSEEGGRTNRTCIRIMRAYVAFLNSLNIENENLAVIETWWIERIKEYFATNPAGLYFKPPKPFCLRFDASKSFQAIIQDLLAQAKKRQQQVSGARYQDTILHHLVGAKLELTLPELTISHNSFSVAKALTDDAGSFVINNSILYITTSPSEAVIRNCVSDLKAGAKPIVLTLEEGVITTKVLAANAGLESRIDIMDVEQFLTANLHALSLFKTSARRLTFIKLIDTYNRIVAKHETDPSLSIVMG